MLLRRLEGIQIMPQQRLFFTELGFGLLRTFRTARSVRGESRVTGELLFRKGERRAISVDGGADGIDEILLFIRQTSCVQGRRLRTVQVRDGALQSRLEISLVDLNEQCAGGKAAVIRDVERGYIAPNFRDDGNDVGPHI